MRTPLLLVLVIGLALPAAGSAALMRGVGDGELSVDSGRGRVTVEARGGVIGRFAEGTVRILDLTPDDIFQPVVFGDELPSATLPSGAVLYRGTNVRFRLVGGRYRITVDGIGIDLSAVGSGYVWLDGDGSRTPGTYSLDGDDCRLARIRCKPLPDERTRLRLGSGIELDKTIRTPG